MNIDTAQLKKGSTNVEAFNFDSPHMDSATSAFVTHHVKYDTLSQGKSTSNSTDNENRWQGLDISIIVSIIIFILGFVIAEFIRRWNKSNELKQYKQFIEEWITKSDYTLNKYISSLEIFSNKIKDNTDLNIVKWEINIIHLSKINEIPLDIFSKIYIFGLRKKEYAKNREQLKNLLFQLEYLDKATNEIRNVYNKYCNDNEQILNEWNTYYMQFLDFLGSNTVDPQCFENDIFNNISHLFYSLMNTKDKIYAGTDNWENAFIKPSMELLLSDERCSESVLLRQVMINVRNLRITLIKHKSLNDYSEVFNEYVQNLKFAQNIINESIEYFSKKKIKRFC